MYSTCIFIYGHYFYLNTALKKDGHDGELNTGGEHFTIEPQQENSIREHIHVLCHLSYLYYDPTKSANITLTLRHLEFLSMLPGARCQYTEAL